MKSARPVAKTAKPAKSAAKPVASKPVKPVKAATKPPSKATAKPTPAKKAAAKPVAKTGGAPGKTKTATTKTTAKAPLKASAKPVVGKSAKPAVKVATKSSPQSAPQKTPKTSAKTPAKQVTPPSSAKPAPKQAIAPASNLSGKVAGNALPKAPAKTVSVQPAAAPAPAPAATRAAKPAGRTTVNKYAAAIPPLSTSVQGLVGAKASFTSSMPASTLTPPPMVVTKKDPKLANNWKNKSAEELTDAEVQAMPDNEYMNEKQMAFFRHKLVMLKQSILSNADETTEHLREDTVVVPDPADRATIEEEHALELRTRDRERKLLKKIEQSISRIDADDYGYCDETGEPIGVGRLIARPTATLSLEAQQRRELKQRMFGD
ncbi:MAG: hypothetical protein RLZZ271_270 [Pseudomonadota bacterium]